jgi:hypothetical protein
MPRKSSSGSYVTCGHCNGEGVCKNGSDGDNEYSCETCFKADGGSSKHGSGNQVVVKCSVCDGSGWVSP